jgi:A/G-specific adenine glycosylase
MPGAGRPSDRKGEAPKIGWRRVPGVVRHIFTHFPLDLIVFVTRVPAVAKAPAGMRWVACADLDGEALPNLMRKVIGHARDACGSGITES